MTKCWNCQTEVIFDGGEDTKHCDKCGYEVDRINQATKEEPVVMIETKSMGMSPFFKKGMLSEGSVGTIKSEFAPSGKFNNYTGEVDFDGVTMKVSLNGTSLRDVSSAYGQDTAKWIGKQITYSVEEIENKKTNAVFRNCNVFRAFR